MPADERNEAPGAGAAMGGAGESPIQGAPPAGGGAGFASKLKRLGSESLIYGLSSVLGRFLSYFLQFMYVGFFTTADNGVQSVVYTYAPILSIVFLWGMDVAYMRSAAAVKDRPLEERQRVFSMSFAIVVVAGAAAALLGLVAAPWLVPVLNMPREGFLYLL